MANTTKTVSGDYTLKATAGVVTLDTPSTVLTGNLTVQGTTTTIDSVNTKLEDNIITLNANASVPPTYSGIEIDRGPAAFLPAIRWNEGGSRWEYTQDGLLYHPFNPVGGVGMLALVDDPAPQLGGNLDTANFYINNASGDFINFEDTLGIKYSAAPASLVNYAKLYANSPAGGGSGVFVVNSTVNEELVTKSKALAFSIIF